jgi:hypothetical protein
MHLFPRRIAAVRGPPSPGHIPREWPAPVRDDCAVRRYSLQRRCLRFLSSLRATDRIPVAQRRVVRCSLPQPGLLALLVPDDCAMAVCAAYHFRALIPRSLHHLHRRRAQRRRHIAAVRIPRQRARPTGRAGLRPGNACFRFRFPAVVRLADFGEARPGCNGSGQLIGSAANKKTAGARDGVRDGR